MKLEKILEFEGTMTAMSGIHIGGSSEGTKVGGSDNPIICNPISRKPYIPGSSIKGCMRSNMELREKKVGRDGGPCICGDKGCIVCTLFGTRANNPTSGPARLIVHEMQLDKDYENEMLDQSLSFLDLIETRTSTSINRNTGAKLNSALRNMEFVAAGVKFHAKFGIKIFEGDNEKKLVDALHEAVANLEHTGIGSKTSAGCGMVKFDIDWDNPNVIEMAY